MYWRDKNGVIHYSAHGVQTPAAEVVGKPEKKSKKSK